MIHEYKGFKIERLKSNDVLVTDSKGEIVRFTRTIKEAKRRIDNNVIYEEEYLNEKDQRRSERTSS